MAEQQGGPPYKSAADVPKGRPTPTQDELNKMNLGEHPELADDGSGPDPHNKAFQGTVVGAPTTKEEKERRETTTHTTRTLPPSRP